MERNIDWEGTEEKAERTAEEIIEYCKKKGMTVLELELLKTTLPIAIDNRISVIKSKTKLL